MAERSEVAIYSPESAVYFERNANEEEPHGGGAEVQMALLAHGLAREGLRTALIVSPRHDPAPNPDGLELVERAPYAGPGGTGMLAEARHIWRAMAAANAEVYLFRGSSPRLWVGVAFCRARRRKLVFSAANDLDFDFGRADRSARKMRLYRAALRRADLVVVQSEQQRELARAVGVGPLELIPSFAEPAEGATRRDGTPGEFLWIGRLVDYKRPLAFVELAESLPEVPFHMVFLATSETDPALTDAVRGASERLENLRATSWLPRPRVEELIAGAAAVVLTSAAEGMPNVFLEAWARGVPVVSLDCDPDGRIEKEGLGIVAGGSVGRLREGVDVLWRDDQRRREMGERGREHVRALHSPEVVGARWAKLVRGLNS